MLARHLQESYRVSERRSCGLMLMSRSVYRYRSRQDSQEPLRKRLRELAAARPRFGYLRLHILLLREGWRVNKKRIYRLYTEEKLQVRVKKRKRRNVSASRVPPQMPTQPNEHWSMDFMADTLAGGKRYRVLTLVDLYTRECLVLEANFSLRAPDVVQALSALKKQGRCPKTITVDNGSEFSSKELDTWAYINGVKLDFIRPGKPVENAYIESFNGRVRDECLNANLSFSLAEARKVLSRWKTDYNWVRPHGSHGGLSPGEFAKQQQKGLPTAGFSNNLWI